MHEVAACLRLETLLLSDNGISNLVGIEVLLQLKVLLLENNAVDSMLQMRPLSILPALNTLSIAGNPLAERARTPQHLRGMIRNIVPGAERSSEACMPVPTIDSRQAEGSLSGTVFKSLKRFSAVKPTSISKSLL